MSLSPECNALQDVIAFDGADSLAVDGLAVDGLAVDGLAVDGLAVDGLPEPHHAHLRSCDECRAFVERTRRMQAHFRTGEMAQSEILRLRLRLGPKIEGMPSTVSTHRRGLAGRVKPVYAALAACVVFASGSVVASGGGTWLLQAVGVTPVQTYTVQAAPKPARRPAARAQEQAPSLTAPAEVAPSKPAAKPQAHVAVPPSNVPKEAPGWREAAAALRDGDYKAADRALSELSRSSDEIERDTAQLSLAQLWLTQGKSEQAQVVLQRLAQSGSSDYVRRRATELLK